MTMLAQAKRGQLLLQQRRPELAEKELRGALALDPDEPMAHALLAMTLGAMGKMDEALRESETAVRLAPDAAFIHYVHAKRLQELERLTEADTAIGEAIRLDPQDADYYCARASICLERGEWSQALEWADRGLAQDADNTDCLNTRSISLAKLGRKAEAHHAAEQALMRTPLDATSHAVQGWNYLEHARPKQALEHFREALRLDPEHEYARSGMVEALKARHLAYRLILRYFLWMAKLSRKAQWAVIIGLYLGNRVLRGVLQVNPKLAPVVVPLLVLYFALCLMSWFAQPLFNLTLALNRFGWHALKPWERTGAVVFGGLLVAGLGALAVGAATSFYVWYALAILCGGLLLPTAGTFSVAKDPDRKKMVVFLAIMAVVGVAALACLTVNIKAWHELAIAFAIGCLGFTWIANLVILRRTHT